jgi:Protein of unknown function (DUF229)
VQPKKKEPDDPLTAFLTEYAWYVQITVVFILYLYSLDSCSYSKRKCQKLNGGHIKYWIISLLIASYIFSTCLLSILYRMTVEWATKGKPTKQTNILVFLTFLAYMFLCSLKEGLTWQRHGTLSRIVFNYFLLIIVCIRMIHRLARAAGNTASFSWTKYAILGLLYSTLGWFAISRIWGAKQTYYDGIGGKRLVYSHVHAANSSTTYDHTQEMCRFHKFSLNYFTTFDEMFWNFAHSHSNCDFRGSDTDWIRLKVGNPFGKVVAYPSTTKLNNTVRQHYQLVQKFVMNNMQLLDKSDIRSSDKEVFLDFTDSEVPTVLFDIKRNDQALKRVQKMKEQVADMQRPNILFIMIDSLSRQHFFRKMPETAEYLNLLYKPGQKLKSYQFFRYHSLSNHAEPNLVTLRYDEANITGEQSHLTRVENYFKDMGWITSTASSKCEIEELDLSMQQKNKMYVDHHPLDHEFYSLACDPNSLPESDPFGMFKGPFSEFRRCVYGLDAAQHQFNYALDFWDKYKSEPKFQSITLTDGHEITGELPRYLDPHLKNFLESLSQKGHLDDAIVFLLSDNGNSGNFLFSGTDSGKNEAANPFISVLLSDQYQHIYGPALERNEQQLISPHDVFRVLGELSHTHKEYTGLNFFKEDIPPNRRCSDAGIDLEFCRCK